MDCIIRYWSDNKEVSKKYVYGRPIFEPIMRNQKGSTPKKESRVCAMRMTYSSMAFTVSNI